MYLGEPGFILERHLKILGYSNAAAPTYTNLVVAVVIRITIEKQLSLPLLEYVLQYNIKL